MYLNEEVNALDNIASLYNSDGGNDVKIPKSFSHENLINPTQSLINPINHGNKQTSQHKGFTTVTAIGTIMMMVMMMIMMMLIGMMIVMMVMMMMMMMMMIAMLMMLMMLMMT
jgi:ABC-type lipoprotein release transport system permease subunit